MLQKDCTFAIFEESHLRYARHLPNMFEHIQERDLLAAVYVRPLKTTSVLTQHTKKVHTLPAFNARHV